MLLRYPEVQYQKISLFSLKRKIRLFQVKEVYILNQTHTSLSIFQLLLKEKRIAISINLQPFNIIGGGTRT